MDARSDEGVIEVGVLRILGPAGDTQVRWDPTDAADVAEVRRRFDEIVREGYLVFELEPGTMQGRRVRSFDPSAGELRAFRQMAGG